MKKIFINANFSRNSIQAQDRDGKHYGSFIDKEEYQVYGYSTDQNVYGPLKDAKNVSYFIEKNKWLIFIKIIFVIVFHRIDIVLSSKAFWKELIYFKVNRIFNNGRNILVLVNQLPYLWGSFDLKIFKKVLDSADHIISISHKIFKGLKNKHNKESAIIPLFYDVDSFATSAKIELKTEIRKKVVCVGSMIAHKNPFLFADTAKNMPEYDFVWIGQGYYFDWIKEKKINEKITNLELIPKLLQNELYEFLSKCDLFYFPSFHEGFPNVVVEALICGLPVIGYGSYGPDAIIDGYNGYILNNFFDAPSRISSILENPAELNNFKSNALNSVKKFDGKILSKELQKLF